MPILIVDDDPTIRDLATLLLTQAGFDQVSAVESPAQAFGVLGLEPSGPARIIPDVILMDIMMPGMDGIEACARIKLDQRFSDVPVLMVTTLSDIEHLKKAFMAGATDYMTKPIRAEELLARVRSAHRFKRELDRRKSREAELAAIAQQISHPASSTKSLAPDAATGLFGEALLLGALGWSLARPERAGIFAAVGFDAWDTYRTRYDKPRCDAVLAQAAAALSRLSAHLGDAWVQLGEGRFGMFCPHAEAAEAKNHADAWRAAIAALKIPHAFSPVGPWLTASAGVVAIERWEGSRADVLAEALSSMSFAEASGGNVTFVSTSTGK